MVSYMWTLRRLLIRSTNTILLSKLECYGVRGLPLLWFQSYLNNRKQICKVHNSLSTFQNVLCSIPQGSNLGPLLFLNYINDLPNSLEITEPAMFAGDNLIFAPRVSRLFFRASHLFFRASRPFSRKNQTILKNGLLRLFKRQCF